MRLPRRLAALAALLALAACTDALGGGTAISVAATGGTRPTYSWNGGAVADLRVTRVGSSTIVYGSSTGAVDGITSPATHGSALAGVNTATAPENPLTAGVTYRVRVERADGSTGSATFTP